jgi:hypothetical protein
VIRPVDHVQSAACGDDLTTVFNGGQCSPKHNIVNISDRNFSSALELANIIAELAVLSYINIRVSVQCHCYHFLQNFCLSSYDSWDPATVYLLKMVFISMYRLVGRNTLDYRKFDSHQNPSNSGSTELSSNSLSRSVNQPRKLC